MSTDVLYFSVLRSVLVLVSSPLFFEKNGKKNKTSVYKLPCQQLAMGIHWNSLMHNFLMSIFMGVPQGSPCQQSLSFACFMLGYSSKTLLELSKVFVEHALHVAIYSFESRPNSCPCGTMGSVMTISLSISGIIDLITVFGAILTSGQTREKLQWLYENLMSNNFRRTAVLKKIWFVN